MNIKYLTIDQAAAILGCHRVAIQQRIRIGDLTGVSKAQVPAEQRLPKVRVYVLEEEILDPRAPHEKRGWITAHEAAAMLGIAHAGIQYYVRQGYLTPLRYRQVANTRGSNQFFDPQQVISVRDNPRPRTISEYGYSPSEGQRGYMAGLIDGEGSIVIRRVQSPALLRYDLTLQIVNTHWPMLEWVQETFGGKNALVHRARDSRRPCYRWITSGETAYHILKLVLPYLQAKAEQARLALEFEEHILHYNGNRWKPVSPDEQAWREEWKQKISALNNAVMKENR